MTRMRFQDSPAPPQPGMVPPGAAHKVMQTSVRMGETTVMASDGPCAGRPSVQSFALSLTVPDQAEGLPPIGVLEIPDVICSTRHPHGPARLANRPTLSCH